MADTKISDLPEETGPAGTDYLVGDFGVPRITKKMLISRMFSAIVGGSITVALGKVVSFLNSLTFVGTDGTTHTFPSTNATLARTDAAQSFTGTQTFTGLINAVKGSASGITVGDVLTNSNAVLRMQGASAGYNWQLENNLNFGGLAITPSTALGGTTYTTPTWTLTPTVMSITGQISASSVNTVASLTNTGTGDAVVGVTNATGTTEGTNRVALFRSNASGRDAYISINDNVSASVRLGQLSGDGYVWINGATRTRFKTNGDLQHLGLLDISGAAAGQISFPASQNASAGANVLDDYEKGTFSPTISGATTAGVGTYSIQTGEYTKVGRVVHFALTVAITAHTGTGGILVTALPFTSANTTNHFRAMAFVADGVTYPGQLAGAVPPNSSQITLYSQATGAGLALVAMDTVFTLYVSGSYII